MPLILLLQPQTQTHEWDEYCIASEQFDPPNGSAEAWFNHNGNCWSDDWLIIYTYGNGTVSIWDPARWAQADPSSGGWYNFDNQNWSCCEPIVSSGGGGGNPTGGCPCIWEWADNMLILDCEF